MIAAIPVLLAPLGRPAVTLAAVGDIMLDRHVGDAVFLYGPGFPLAKVRTQLRSADLDVANLECPLTVQPKQLKKPILFQVPPVRVKCLQGIDLVSVANNHALDCGRSGLAETLRTLKASGIEACGGTPKPTIVTRKGLRVAFIGFSDFPETVPGNQPGITYYDHARIAKIIKEAQRQADVVVLFAHWGIEGTTTPSSRQRQEAKEMAAAGADLILGSHPHVLQPVEHIGRTVVAYSMGDFVFDTIKPRERRTAIFRFRLTKSGVTILPSIPCTIDHARPIPLPSR